MIFNLRKERKFSYTINGDGSPILLIHGLMGGLSNFENQVNFFSKNGYKVYSLELPLYSLPVLKTNLIGLMKHCIRFIDKIIQEPAILVGNSLGGHIALLVTIKNPDLVSKLVLTGSSGLYEKSFGESYPKRGNYEYIKKKTEEVFYSPEIATKELVDQVYSIISDRNKAIKIIQIARSAIRHNLSNDLKNIYQDTCIIWGKQDNVTPPDVAKEFNSKIVNSSLFWIDKCGHSAMMEKPEEFNNILYNWLNNK